MTTGYIVLGHGSRAKEANENLDEITKIVAGKLNSQQVVAACLEFCHPNLEDAIEILVERGCDHIIIAPFFLAKGMHIKRDVPAIIANLTAKYNNKISFHLTEHIGVDERLGDILIDRIKGV